MIRVLNQRRASYCYCCRATEAEEHDIKRVKNGFYADMNMEELLDFGRELMTEKGIAEEDWSSHVFVAEKGDYGKRFGMKGLPLSSIVDSTRAFAILHSPSLTVCLYRDSDSQGYFQM